MRLTPHVPSHIEQTLSYTALAPLVHKENGPIAITYPAIVQDTARALAQHCREVEVEARFFGAHKATCSIDAIAATRAAGFGCDVASLQELQNAQLAGFAAEEISATGPKSNKFLAELVRHPEVTIVLDSYSELERLLMLPNVKNPVLLRMSRSMVNRQGVAKLSRFGMDNEAFERSVARLLDEPSVPLRGVAFHLDSQSIDECAHAVRVGIDILLRLQDEGFMADVLNVGGGFGSDYGLSKAQIQRFETHIVQDVASGARMATWQGKNYGLTVHNGAVQGSMSDISIPRGATGVEYVKEVLAAPYGSKSSIATTLRENLIELWCEPGASLYQAAGVVVAEVIETHKLDGKWHVVVDIHRNQLCFEGSEVPSDPLLFTQNNHPAKTDSYALVGHLCAESDMLHRRFVELPYHPQPGDIFVWTHTGAYRAHFSASSAIGHPLAKQYTYRDGEFYAIS